MEKEIKLFDAVMKSGGVRRQGDISMVNLGMGRGAIIVPSIDFMQARRWGLSKNSTGKPMRDMTMLLDHLELYIARQGSQVQTKGHPKRLIKLAREMAVAGYDHAAWSLPREVLAELEKKPSDDDEVAEEASAEEAEFHAQVPTDEDAEPEVDEIPLFRPRR